MHGGSNVPEFLILRRVMPTPNIFTGGSMRVVARIIFIGSDITMDGSLGMSRRKL